MAAETAVEEEGPLTAQKRYAFLEPLRKAKLDKARVCSALTIPALLPPEGHTESSTLYQPFQSAGADGVNNLASKLSLALFPPGQSCFKLTLDGSVVDQLAARGEGQDIKAEFDEALSKMERSITDETERHGTRSVRYECLKHLIVAGNGLMFVDKSGDEKFFPLDRYVVKRDLEGNVLEIITKESIARTAMPKRAREIVESNPETDNQSTTTGAVANIDIYTWVRRQENGSFKVHQEVSGKVIPGSEGTYPKDKSAFIPLRWTIVPGEDYGRGRCEEYFGDLQSLEALEKAIVEFAAQAAKIIWLVNEGGVTNKEDLAHAESGDVLDGDAKDVTVLAVEKFHDFQVIAKEAEKLENRLGRAFLLASSVQRNAERVTAEEIRAMVGELEQSLGGVYSLLAEEFQRPLIVRRIHQMEKAKKLPSLPEGAVNPQIVTGLEGLGRTTDLQKLDVFIAGVGQQFGQEAVAKYVNIGAYMKRRAAALGIDLTGLVRDEQEVQAADQQAMKAEMVHKLGPTGIKAASDQMLAARAPPAEAAPAA